MILLKVTLWCIQRSVYIFVPILCNYLYAFGWYIDHVQCYDFTKKNRSGWFLCQGEETGKEHQCDNCCWLWIIDQPNMTLMGMTASMHAGLHVRVHPCTCVECCCVRPAGALLFDRSQGFWLSHSIPHFPSFPERGYLYPSSGKVNGQTALCVTYQYEQFLRIGECTGMRQKDLTYSSSLHIPDFNLSNSLFAGNKNSVT